MSGTSTPLRAWLFANSDDPEGGWAALEQTLRYFAEMPEQAVPVTRIDRLTTEPAQLEKLIAWRVVEPYTLILTRSDDEHASPVLRAHTPPTRAQLARWLAEMC